MFTYIESLNLLFTRYPESHDLFDDKPDHKGDREGEGSHCQHADGLIFKKRDSAAVEKTVACGGSGYLVLGEESHGQCSEDSIYKVNGKGSHRIVEFEPVKEYN